MRFATMKNERVWVCMCTRGRGSTHVLWLFTTASFALKIKIAGNYFTNKALKKKSRKNNTNTNIHTHTIMHAHKWMNAYKILLYE